MAMIDFDEGGGSNYDPQMGGRFNYTDPVRDLPPAGTSGSVGAGIPWNPGASQPSANPPGYSWDATYANFIPQQTQSAAPNNHGRVDAAVAGARSSDDPNYWYGKIDSDPNGYGSAWDYWLDRINRGDGAQLGLPRFQDGPAPQQPSAPAGGSYASTNPFSDPATKSYIDLLNSRIQSLLTPQQNPDMEPLLGYMRKYFAQLQNPVYTDAQRGILQTQQLDPMERRRQARKQQVIQQMAARGMSPSDGPTVSALQEIDRQFDTLRSQAQGGQAVNEINLGRQNQQQAVDVGSAIAQLQNGMFQQQDQRANQAVGYAKGIPDLAQQRLAQSIQLLNGNSVNPASLFSSLQGFQNQGMLQSGQDSAFYQQLFAALAKAFGL